MTKTEYEFAIYSKYFLHIIIICYISIEAKYKHGKYVIHYASNGSLTPIVEDLIGHFSMIFY